MGSRYFFDIKSIKSQYSNGGGSLTSVSSAQVPGFVNISFASLSLKPKGFQEPIWHPNANKIGYCQKGEAVVTMRTPQEIDAFTVREGDIFFIPEGFIHSIKNTLDAEEARILFAFNNTDPEVMRLTQAIGSLSDNVFDATFNENSVFLNGLKKSPSQDLVKLLDGKIHPQNRISSRFKFNILESEKTIQTKGGYLQLGTKGNLPVLNALGILRFGLNEKGNVEPHWHTNAGELVYIVKGKSKITVLDPQGHVEVLNVSAGEGAFAPASHFHNIENIGPDEVEVIAFFSHAEPDYIGIGEAIGVFSNEELASIFNVPQNYFDSFKKPEGPLVIVPV